MKHKLVRSKYKPHLADRKRLKIENIKVGRNRHGQVFVSFESENHKYLDVRYNVSGNALGIRDVNGSYVWCHGISIENDPEMNEELGFACATDAATLWLIPENEEEAKALGGCAVVVPTKWAYDVCVVKYEDLGPV